jgi:hypothetical protein
VLAFVDTPHPSPPRRRAVRGPLLALAGALALYVALWVVPWRLHPSTGRGALRVYQVRQDGRLDPVSEGGAVPVAAKLAFSVSSEREASVVVLALYRRRVVLASPTQPATGAIERVQPGSTTMLADRPVVEGPPGQLRFLAVFCKSALPPETVFKPGSGRSRWVRRSGRSADPGPGVRRGVRRYAGRGEGALTNRRRPP